MKTYRVNAVMGGGALLSGNGLWNFGRGLWRRVLTSLISSKPLAGVELLSLVAADSSRLTVGAFFTLMMGLSLAAMTLFLYPVFRKDNEGLALGLVLFVGP